MAKKKVAKKAAKKKVAKKTSKKKVAKKVAKKVSKKVAKKKVAKKTSKKKVAKKASKKVAKKKVAKKVATKKVAKKTSKKKVAKKVAKKKVAKKAAKKVAKKAKKVAKKKVAKKAAKKVAKKAKKVAKKKVAKKVAKKATKKKVAKKKAVTKKDVGKKAKGKQAKDSDVDEAALKNSIERDIKESLTEEVLSLTEELTLDEVFDVIQNMDFFKSDDDECIERNCDNPDTTSGYCRYHYIKNWGEIKRKQTVLEGGKLITLIRDLVEKYPLKMIQEILGDLSDDKNFYKVLKELNIVSAEESFDDLSDEQGDDDQDIAYETKSISRRSFDEDS